MGTKTKTFYLFAKPSFVGGMARIFDIGANFDVYNESKTDKEADYKAISNDWKEVGLDIKKSIREYDRTRK